MGSDRAVASDAGGGGGDADVEAAIDERGGGGEAGNQAACAAGDNDEVGAAIGAAIARGSTCDAEVMGDDSSAV